MNNSPLLSIIIPAYNESATIQQVLDKVVSSLTNNSIDAEIILVDDASKDDTLEKVESCTRLIQR